MTANWLRRAARLAACASVAVLAACGSSAIDSSLSPARFVSFGDAFSDVGFNGTRYTVNDGSANVWTLQVASRYALPLAPQSAGGTSYARGNARIVDKPDAAGNGATLTVKEQIDTFAAADKFAERDVVFVNGGISDIVAQNQAALSESARLANVQQAARDLGAQVRRLVDLGAKYVVVTGTYDLGRSPYAAATGRASALNAMSRRFNDTLLVSLVDLGANVLYVDSEFFTNLMVNGRENYSLTDVTTVACTSVDSGPGIGIGAGQVNSARCNTGTVVAGADYNTRLFADPLYQTPNPQRQFGNYAYDKLRARW